MIQSKPPKKKSEKGIIAPVGDVTKAAASETNANNRNKQPTAIKTIRCDFLYLYASLPDSK